MDCSFGIEKIQIMIYCNLIIFIFNLIPIFPLDGGRIIKSIIKILFGKQKAEKSTYLISNITIIIMMAIGSILILYLKNISVLIIIIYLWYLVHKENRSYEIKNKLYEIIN